MLCKKTGQPCRMCMWGWLKDIKTCENIILDADQTDAESKGSKAETEGSHGKAD